MHISGTGYRGSIENRDTWDGIIIVALILGITQHYFASTIIRIRTQTEPLFDLLDRIRAK